MWTEIQAWIRRQRFPEPVARKVATDDAPLLREPPVQRRDIGKIMHDANGKL
jgi:hypothetical protein